MGGCQTDWIMQQDANSWVWINGTYVDFTLINDVEIITDITCRQQPTTISSVYSISLQDSNLGRQVTRFVVIYCVHSFSQQARDLWPYSPASISIIQYGQH